MAGAKQSARSVQLVDASLSCGEAPSGVRLPMPIFGVKKITANFTRPANATAYTVGDVVGPVTTPAVMTFTGAARDLGLTGVIHSAVLSITGTVATNGSFRLYLYDTAPTAIADNLPFTMLVADAPNMIGLMNFTVGTEGSGSTVLVGQATTELRFKCTSGVKDIYGVLVAEGAFTPGSGDVVRVNLNIAQ